jgi:hypothetical protein
VPGYGLYISPGEQFTTLADIMNYSSQQQTMQVRLHVTWAPGDALTHITPVCWTDRMQRRRAILLQHSGRSLRTDDDLAVQHQR